MFFNQYCPYLGSNIFLLIAAFSIDKTREYLDKCLALPYTDDSYTYAASLFFPYCSSTWFEWKKKVISALRCHTKIDIDKSALRRTFDPDKFIEYAIYQRIREGMALSSSEWFRTWDDTLDMEMQLFGKIKKKYPKNLQTYHNQLSYLYSQKQGAIQKKAIIKRKNELSKYSWTNGKYLIRCPESDTDFLDEAHQQANCLALPVTPMLTAKVRPIFSSCATSMIRNTVLLRSRFVPTATVSQLSGRRTGQAIENRLKKK